jgi:F-type H+-transporting ATPase subunit delta
MASHAKIAQQRARQFFKMSFADGAISADRVGGVLAYVEKNKPANTLMILKAYQRLVAAEVAKGVALVEHAGAINDGVLSAIASSMTKKYGRKVTASARPNPALLAGIRVHVGDDIYESSIAAQLDALASAV